MFPPRMLLALLPLLAPVLLAGSAAAQTGARRSITLVVPESYPAFDAAQRAANPQARELHALVLYRTYVAGSPAPDAPIRVLLNPAHLDAPTLRAAFLEVQRYRSRGSPRDAGFAPIAASTHPIPAWSQAAYDRALRLLRAQPVDEVPGVGEGRALTIENLGDFVRAPAGSGER